MAAEDEVAHNADEGAYLAGHDDRLARGEGTGGGASAEEAAIRYRIGES